MFWSDDPHRDFDRYEAHQQRQLDRLPKCSECDEPIQDERLIEFNGEIICPRCLKENHVKWTEDYTD